MATGDELQSLQQINRVRDSMRLAHVEFNSRVAEREKRIEAFRDEVIGRGVELARMQEEAERTLSVISHADATTDLDWLQPSEVAAEQERLRERQEALMRQEAATAAVRADITSLTAHFESAHTRLRDAAGMLNATQEVCRMRACVCPAAALRPCVADACGAIERRCTTGFTRLLRERAM